MNLLPFYAKFHYYVFQRLVGNPSDVYFKLDDDIVYISPNVFGTMLKPEQESERLLHPLRQHCVQLEMQLASSTDLDWRF